MLTTLTQKVDNKQEQRNPVIKIEILRIKKNSRKNFQKNTIEGMKSAFEGLIGRSDIAEERISKLENMSVETPKTEKQRGKMTLKIFKD